jgi:hypothetical protein
MDLCGDVQDGRQPAQLCAHRIQEASLLPALRRFHLGQPRKAILQMRM